MPEEQRELVDGEESIVEHDVRSETELERTLLEHQPVPLALAPLDVGMRAAGDRVDEVRIPLDDRRKRLDHGLDPLAGRDEAERREAEPAVAAIARCDLSSRALAARAIRRAGAPCGTTRTFSSGHVPESTSSRSAVSVITITSSASLHSSVSTSAWCARRLGQDRVQRHDERLRELAREREDVLAVPAAEDPVLVLEQHDVDVEPPQHPGRSDVVAANRLRDRRK